MKRPALILGVIVLACLAVAPVAAADRPSRFPAPVTDSVVSGICPFDVNVEFLQSNQYALVFSNGSAIVTGALKVRLTNLSDTSKSLTANISGPGMITPTADGGLLFTLEGPAVLFFFPGELGPGSPGLFQLTKGRGYITVDAAGNETYTAPRNTTDICAALA